MLLFQKKGQLYIVILPYFNLVIDVSLILKQLLCAWTLIYSFMHSLLNRLKILPSVHTSNIFNKTVNNECN